MGFESAYQNLLRFHQSRRTGERLRRLQPGVGHAEKTFLKLVWWPAFGNFDHLHPEYEVSDFKDGYRYLDFAYLRPHIHVAVEIDGFTTHLQNLSRPQFSDHLQRQNHLMIDGWRIMRFSYDDVTERPRLCQQTMQQLLGRLLGTADRLTQASAHEREVIRLVTELGRPIKPKDVQMSFGVSADFARDLLHGMVDKGWLLPESGVKRIRSYQLGIDVRT